MLIPHRDSERAPGPGMSSTHTRPPQPFIAWRVESTHEWLLHVSADRHFERQIALPASSHHDQLWSNHLHWPIRINPRDVQC